MNVLLINGSPHKHGCTYTALSEVAGRLEEHGIAANIVHIGAKAIRGCIACGRCQATGLCVFDDDPVNECVERLNKADGLVIGSPVYYASPNGALLALRVLGSPLLHEERPLRLQARRGRGELPPGRCKRRL